MSERNTQESQTVSVVKMSWTKCRMTAEGMNRNWKSDKKAGQIEEKEGRRAKRRADMENCHEELRAWKRRRRAERQ